jgi:hypothetical protein
MMEDGADVSRGLSLVVLDLGCCRCQKELKCLIVKGLSLIAKPT